MENLFEEATNPLKSKNNGYLQQYVLSFSCFLQSFMSGAALSYSSILMQSDTVKVIKLNTNQLSWIASIPLLLMIPAVLLVGAILNLIGRRLTFAVAVGITIVSWLLLYLAQSYTMYLVSRVLTGINFGLCYATMIVYLGEVTHPKIRPQCLCSIPIGSATGIMITQLLGYYLHFKTIALVLTAVPIINLLILAYVKESYVWLLNKSRMQRAKADFTWYRGSDIEARLEFIAALETKSSKLIANKDKIRFCLTKAFITPFLISALLYLTGELSGDNAVIFYTSSFVKLITDNPNAQFYTNLSLNLVRVIGTMSCSLLYRKFSIRSVLIVSGYLMALSLGTLSLFKYLQDTYPNNKIFSIICMVSIICNVIFYAIGLGPVPAIICGEIYPTAVRDIGGALSGFVMIVSLFILIKILPCLFETVQPTYIFLIFSFSTFIGITITSFVVPNTKDKTLPELDDLYFE